MEQGRQGVGGDGERSGPGSGARLAVGLIIHSFIRVVATKVEHHCPKGYEKSFKKCKFIPRMVKMFTKHI